MRSLSFVSILFLFLACSSDGDDPIIIEGNRATIDFKDQNQKVSYCIGLDHAFAAYTIYGSPENKPKFDMAQIEAGMIDYLNGNELRIPFEARDSIFGIYLLPDGTVNEKAIPKVDASYAIGMEEGYVLVSSLVGRGIDQTVDVEMLIRGIKDGIQSREPAVDLIEARTEVANYYSQLNLENGQYFLSENAKSDSVVVTESGLQYIVFNPGKGESPNLTDTCVVHYTGRLLDGREFESTIPSQKPAVLTPMGLIPGWQEGLQLMKKGAQFRFFMPYELGFGEKGSGPIEPYSVLVYDIELLEIRKFN